MEIRFNRRKDQKTFESKRELQKKFGDPVARKIMARMGILKNAPNLTGVPTTPPTRLHQLTGNREGQFAVDLGQPYRLVFAPNHEPLPTKDDGGLDRGRVTAIIVLEVVDYH